jgi:EAL domain-containing protein (putative c-di-GMP-specific phosphodiesterase class I)
VALDDLGAGYSALGRLSRLPVDLVKIAQVLVSEPAAPGRPAAPLVPAVVTLGRQLGLAVVADGVVTTEQRQAVEAGGCRLAQGELFGAPMPAEHVEALLASARPVPVLPAARSVQDVRQVDSGHEMRQS